MATFPIFNSPYVRNYDPILIKLSSHGPLYWVLNDKVDMNTALDKALFAETSWFSSSGHRNARMTAASDTYLAKFARKSGGYLMIPIYVVTFQVACLIAGSPTLRAEFNTKYPGHSIPTFVNNIMQTVRGTNRNGLRVELTDSFCTKLQSAGFKGTIFDNEFVLSDNSAKSLVFSIATGSLLHAYELPLSVYTPCSLDTEHFTSGSIVVRKEADRLTFRMLPISTIKSNNNMFDPTLDEANAAIFCGLIRYSDNFDLSVGVTNTYFVVNLDINNYFPTLLSLCAGKIEGFCNPTTFKKPRNGKGGLNNVKTEPKDENTAMTAVTGIKINSLKSELTYETIKLFNNIYATSKPTFFKLLKANAITNLKQVF